MFKAVSQRLAEHSVSAAYTRRFRQKGAKPEGVFWASQLSQIARFEQALTHLAGYFGANHPYRLTDVGCGYGALFDFISNTPRYGDIAYQGVDINKEMVRHCHQRFPRHKALFTQDRKPGKQTDASVFIGTFNLCHTDDYALWEDYILSQLDKSWAMTSHIMVLNMTSLTSPQIRNDIFYAEPQSFSKKLSHYFGKVSYGATKYLNDDVCFVIRR